MVTISIASHTQDDFYNDWLGSSKMGLHAPSLCCAREALLKIGLSSVFHQPCIGYPA